MEFIVRDVVRSTSLHQGNRIGLDLSTTWISPPDEQPPTKEVTSAINPRQPVRFEFQVKDTYCRTPKRRRHHLDVDGFNTAALSSKKRRLRADLVTSRLSQPYSQPATHILNREGAKSGDKRFSKIATSLDASRRGVIGHTNSLLRYSLVTRLRRRLGLGRPARLDGGEDSGWQSQSGRSNAMARMPWAQQGHVPTPPAFVPAARPAVCGPSQSPPGRPPFIASLPLPSTNPRPSQVRPIRLPELRQHQGAYDELDEGGAPFPHAEGDGDSDVGGGGEQVYSDFGVIFGAPMSDEDSSYEEYLDELDGLCWVTM